MDSAFAQLRLPLGDCDQCPVVDGFDESVSQGVEGGAQCADVFCRGYVLLGLGTYGAIINDGPAGNRVFSVVDDVAPILIESVSDFYQSSLAKPLFAVTSHAMDRRHRTIKGRDAMPMWIELRISEFSSNSFLETLGYEMFQAFRFIVKFV